MSEALQRRYARVKKGEVPTPAILFIDRRRQRSAGRAAMKVLGELELDWLNVVGVAKGRSRRPGAEQLFRPGEAKSYDHYPTGFASVAPDPANT